MGYLSILETMECRFKAEVRCLKRHIESLDKILEKDLSKFDGKLINVEFSKAIGYLVTKNDREEDCYGFRIYIYDSKTIHESTGMNTCVYADRYRDIKVTFNTAENRRIDVKRFRESLMLMIVHLRSELNQYESDLRNWGSIVKRMEKRIQDIIDYKSNLSYELRVYFHEQLKRI